MKILICDPADNDAIDYLKKNGIEVIYNPNISADELVSEVSRFDGLLVRSRTKVTNEVIKKGVSLKLIGRVGAGIDNIDIEGCKKKKIIVVNAPFANSQSVVELTIGIIISLFRKINFADKSMKEGKWVKNEIKGIELTGKTVGIVGYGSIGQKVAKLLECFGCKILFYSRTNRNSSLNDIFEKSDIVTIHMALNSESKGMVGINLLSKMKKEAYLINISRGEIIIEDDLYKILSEHKIAGCALDVYWQEPLPEDSRWRKLENVILTPHIGGLTTDAMKRAGLTVSEDIVRISKDEKPKYQVI